MLASNWSRLVVLLVLVAIAPACVGQTAEFLIKKNLSARGGASKLHAIRTMLMTGTISFGNASSPLTVKVERPNRIREDFQVQGSPVIRAFDGASGWESQGGKARSLAGGELNNIREEAENAIEGLLLDYAKKGSRVEYAGKATINGKSAYKLKIITTLGTTITQYLDEASYLEVHEEIERSVNGQTTIIVEDVSDYRDVAGVKFAHRFVSGSKENPSAAALQMEKMQLNVPISAGSFEQPK